MKNDEHMAWDRLRDHASSQLPADFSRRVVRQAVRQRKVRQVSRVLMAVAVTLFITVSVGNWWRDREEERQQMVQWEEWQGFQEVMLSSR